MATKVNVKPLTFENPAWSAAEAKPGDEVELKVTAKDLEAGLTVFFEISGDHGRVDFLKGKAEGDDFKAKWKAPNPPGTVNFTFDAVLRQTPTPQNGQLTVRRRLTSGPLKVSGYRVLLDPAAVDAAFVPKQEQLNAKFKIEDAGGAAKAGRYEIWGERYPSDKPLYTEDFVPAAGDVTWKSWDGKANDGMLSGKYISPEFSPYRLRVIIGPDADSVKDPAGKGHGKVAMAEAPFEVRIQSLNLRLQTGLDAGVQANLNDVLAIEPQSPDGTFPNGGGRLPAPAESARIRIPCERHTLIPDSLDQGGDTLAGNYMSSGPTKWKRDSGIYSRPELPLEIEARLQSRDPAKNGAPGFGLFEPAAVGALHVEPFAEEQYPEAALAAASAYGTYWKNSVHKIKRGTHQAPKNAGAQPIFGYWQGRYKIAADGDRDIAITAQDAGFTYALGKSELTVYLNRTKLVVGAAGAANVDVEEIDATHIKLAAGLTKANDIVWVVRNDSTAAGGDVVAHWSSFPPGANCHVHYGGIRGEAPNNLFLDKHSTPGGGKAAIIGKDAAAFPFTAGVLLDPDDAKKDRERVETVALDSGAKQGLAGILFSPSFVAGDSYILGAQIEHTPYQRTLGFIQPKPKMVTKTGAITIWRVMTISRSLRMPAQGTAGLPAAVGNAPDTPLAGRAHRGDGVNMNMAGMNTELSVAFNEWTIPAPTPPATDTHEDINLNTYIGLHDGKVPEAAATKKGAVKIGAVANVTNEFVQFDYYRVQLPPGTPAGRRQAISAAINALARGSLSTAAMAAASAALPGPAQPAKGIPVFAGGGRSDYKDWIDGVVDTISNHLLDKLTPQDPKPRTMQTIRWPNLFQRRKWDSGTPPAPPAAPAYTDAANTTTLRVLGFCRGHGQSFFATTGGTGTTFAHEMGHSVHLVHFTAGNFAWKHHDLTTPTCKMSYGHTRGYIPQPAGAVGPGAGSAEDTGWPDVMANPLPPNTPSPTGYAAGAATVEITVLAKPSGRAALAVGTFCGKCLMKVRGWKEDVLPAAWRHPDLF